MVGGLVGAAVGALVGKRMLTASEAAAAEEWEAHNYFSTCTRCCKRSKKRIAGAPDDNTVGQPPSNPEPSKKPTSGGGAPVKVSAAGPSPPPDNLSPWGGSLCRLAQQRGEGWRAANIQVSATHTRLMWTWRVRGAAARSTLHGSSATSTTAALAKPRKREELPLKARTARCERGKREELPLKAERRVRKARKP